MTKITTIATTTSHASTLLLSDFILFCSFILSHPLYFSYFIFFSPYILKLLSFLSPLFITTFLLLLALLSVSIDVPSIDVLSPPPKASFLLSSYQVVLNTLRSSLDNEGGKEDEFCLFEDLEACIEVLEKSIFEVEVDSTRYQVDPLDTPIDIHVVESSTYQDALDPPKEIVAPIVEEEKHVSYISLETKNNGENKCEIMKTPSTTPLTPKIARSPSMLGLSGSMRKEKEWKRTLACKLYEERQNVNDGVEGGEGMDLLWEAYECETGKKTVAAKANNGNKDKVKKKEVGYDEEEDEEEEEEDVNVQLCCLQALKFSTRKMNLGMGKPNLVKISKALKGIGWFHHMRKHGKKG